MRYIVVFLLIANIAYFGWVQFTAAEPTDEDETPGFLINRDLMLISEFNEMSPQQARELSESERLCSVVTGFSDLDVADDFMEAAREAGLGAQMVQTGNELPPYFRVYLEPSEDLESAQAALDRLADQLNVAQIEMETSLIVTGPLTNAVAMGTYENEASARVVQSFISTLNYKPQLEEIPRYDGETQVWLRASNSGRVNEAQWLDLTAERPELARTENLCETIAQVSQFP